MFRIDDATASSTLPVPEAADVEGYFTEGNPGVTEATLVRASWLNMIQEELRAIVIAGGLTPSKTQYSQVLTAIRSMLGNYATQKTIAAAGNILVADMGKVLNFSGVPGVVFLPSAASVSAGSSVTIFPQGSGWTISTSNSENLNFGALPATSRVLNSGDTMTLESDGASSWLVVGGLAAIKSSPLFASLLGTSGYQKLPSGLIVQWAIVTTDSSGTTTFFHPVSFPSVKIGSIITVYGSNGANSDFTATYDDVNDTNRLASTRLVTRNAGVLAQANAFILTVGY